MIGIYNTSIYFPLKKEDAYTTICGVNCVSVDNSSEATEENTESVLRRLYSFMCKSFYSNESSYGLFLKQPNIKGEDSFVNVNVVTSGYIYYIRMKDILAI